MMHFHIFYKFSLNTVLRHQRHKIHYGLIALLIDLSQLKAKGWRCRK